MFLGLTALSEFWKKDQEILFLGSWCLRYDRRHEWEGLKYQVMPSPWDDRKRFYDAAQYLDEYGERMLACLTDYLNEVHGVSHSRRYWRVLIGAWLFHYLHACYDRFTLLTEAFERYPYLETIMLDPQSFRGSRDTNESIDLIIDDPFNLQIFSQFLQHMGFSFPALRLEYGKAGAGQDLTSGRSDSFSKRLAKRWLGWASDAIGRTRRHKRFVALCDMYCPRSQMWRLAWHANLLAVPCEVSREWSFPIDEPVFDGRRNALAGLGASNEFERLLVKTLPQNFPSLYLEAYSKAREEARAQWLVRRTPVVVVSAVGWYGNEPFKFGAAEASEQGSRLVTVQHGGGYGIRRSSPTELHESRLGSSFMAWGWAEKEKESCRNLPRPKFSLLLTSHASKTRSLKSRTILFVSTAHPRYLHCFHSAPVGSQREDYFAWQLRFLSAVSHRLRSMIIFRKYLYVYESAVPERFSERFSDIRWDNIRSFYRRLKHARIVVIDNCVTTFLEALVANVPIILYWDPCRWEVREEAEPYFENLRKASILWDSPEAAAKKVEEVYENPWAWWGSEQVQEIRKRFVDRYALAREDWVECWVEALKDEVTLCQVEAQ